eukprot:1132993-Rhodomonas_salina.1
MENPETVDAHAVGRPVWEVLLGALHHVPGTYLPTRAIRDVRPKTPKSGSLNPKAGSVNPKSGSLNPKFGSLNPKSGSLKPKLLGVGRAGEVNFGAAFFFISWLQHRQRAASSAIHNPDIAVHSTILMLWRLQSTILTFPAPFGAEGCGAVGRVPGGDGERGAGAHPRARA